ncbi:MAG: ABC transporter ATP-binding protein [Chlamydiia bacterium]|nr:ABC transporter ATP-binding protein [Chlamydiia bacterium]
MTPPTAPLLKIQDLSVTFSLYGQKLHAVRGISFTVNTGEAVGIVGESGCGKSAAVQAITRLSPASNIEGSILFEGENLLQKSEKELQKIRGKRIGMVFQDPMSALNPTMPIGAQIEEALVHHKIVQKGTFDARARVLTLLRQVELPQAEERLKQYPHQLSGGMRQRVLIAIALACGPRLLIADEPTTALDVTVQAQILDLFRKRDASTSLLLITHDLGVVAETCDRILVFYAGKIVEQGSVQEVLERPQHPYTQMLLQSLPTHKGPLQVIEGMPPNLLDPPKGCAFAERCPHAAPICQTDPPFFGNTACWRYK